MDSKDLNIGDFVKHSGVTKIVDAVQLYSVSVHDPSEEWSISEAKTYPVDDIEPIKLTEDILVKNGTKISSFTGTLYWFNEDEHCCVKPIEDTFLFMYSKGADYITFRINYVYQLQHLLRLCGIEKELTI